MAKRKYALSERRRCPQCKRKSYSKFIGRIEISAYHCEKCQRIFYWFLGPLEFVEMIRDLSSDIFDALTVSDLKACLESSMYRWPTTQKRWREIVEEDQRRRERQNLSCVLGAIIFLEKQHGMAELDLLSKSLKSEYDIDPDDTLRLIRHLKTKGIIYEPKKGYFKKT